MITESFPQLGGIGMTVMKASQVIQNPTHLPTLLRGTVLYSVRLTVYMLLYTLCCVTDAISDAQSNKVSFGVLWELKPFWTYL